MKALETGSLRHGDLLDALAAAPYYQRFAPATRHAIRVIHGLPTLFRGRALSQIEIYVGRTACDPVSLRGRWGSHRRDRSHDFGIVLFLCPTSQVQRWEAAANRLVRRLAARRALCVANVYAGGQGPLPSLEDACVYLTWRFRASRACLPVRRRELPALAREVAEADPEGPSADSVLRGISALPNPRDRASLGWVDS